nr:TIGR03905 family TSCPD domain-containing protein [Prevotella sp.]
MNKLTYKTHGTCSQYIIISVDDNGNVGDVEFIGGCNGNTKGICSLIKGMKAKDVKERLKGILCGNKPTSCPDQLATALEEMGY